MSFSKAHTAFQVRGVPVGDHTQSNTSGLNPGWQWKFRTIFGETYSYMSHNTTISEVKSESDNKDATGQFSVPNFESGLADDALVWERYLHESQAYDKDIIDHWNGNMDVLLVFTGLFSGVLTAFIIEFYRTLQPDPSDQSVILLNEIAALLRCQQNQTACPSSPVVLPDINNLLPSTSAWVVNLLWFTSLTLTLTVSLLVLFAKQWIRAYKTDAAGPRHKYVRHRQYKLNGVKSWYLPIILNTLPQVLFVALIMFLIGLVILLQTLDKRTFLVCLVIVLSLILFSITTPVLPAIYPDCPFRTVNSEHMQIFDELRKWYYQLRGLALPPDHPIGSEKPHRTQLDADALEWLLLHSNDQKTIDMALKGISAISSDMAFKHLRNDTVAKLLLSRIQSLSVGELSLGDIQSITYYLQGVYLVLLNRHPFTDVWATAYSNNLERELHDVLAKLGEIPGEKVWDTCGVFGLFNLRSVQDCNWMMEEVYADNKHSISNNTLWLAMTRLYALHIQDDSEEMQDHATVRLLLRYLCHRLYKRDLASFSDDRLVKLGILIIHMLAYGRSDWHKKQYPHLDSIHFQELLPQSLVKIFAHYNYFGLKRTACRQLWELMQQCMEQYKISMLLTYRELSSNERHTFYRSLDSLHIGIKDPEVWQGLISFLSLTLDVYETPPDRASELVVQYLLRCSLETSRSYARYDMLRNMSTHVNHCKYLLGSRAWNKLVEDSRTVYLAMDLIRTTLSTLIRHIPPWSPLWEDIDAIRLFTNLNHNFTNLNHDFTNPSHNIHHIEDVAPEILLRQSVIKEWLGILNALSLRYKSDIINSRLPQVILGLPGTDDLEDRWEWYNQMVKPCE